MLLWAKNGLRSDPRPSNSFVVACGLTPFAKREVGGGGGGHATLRLPPRYQMSSTAVDIILVQDLQKVLQARAAVIELQKAVVCETESTNDLLYH